MYIEMGRNIHNNNIIIISYKNGSPRLEYTAIIIIMRRRKSVKRTNYYNNIIGWWKSDEWYFGFVDLLFPRTGVLSCFFKTRPGNVVRLILLTDSHNTCFFLNRRALVVWWLTVAERNNSVKINVMAISQSCDV